jgi:starvation-inducible DNA-binding protein
MPHAQRLCGLRSAGVTTATSLETAPVPVDEVAQCQSDTTHQIELIALMNCQLSTAVDLQTQTKQAHWNVKGPSFIALHELFDRVAASVADSVDLIAERIAQLGGTAEGTTRIAAQWSCLEAHPIAITDGLSHVQAVAQA